jgi:hypothetical protein
VRQRGPCSLPPGVLATSPRPQPTYQPASIKDIKQC